MTAQSRLTLAFSDGNLERAFLTELNEVAGRRFRIVILFVLLFYVPFGVITALVIPDTPPEIIWIRATNVAVGVFLAVLSFTAYFRARYQGFVAAGCVTFGAITALLVFRVHSGVASVWQTAAAIVVVFVVNAVFRLRFVYSSLIGVGLALLFIFLFHRSHPNDPATVLFSGWVLFSAFYAATISYEIERYARSAFENADRLAAEQEKSEGLLRNILPESVAQRLKASSDTIADRFDGVAVVFADIVDFTTLSQRLSPLELVAFLNNVFTRFDRIANAHGVEKIKTIGDAYMAAAGVPEPCADADVAVAECALAMREEALHFKEASGHPVQLRIGIHCGPAVAGVIGMHKFAYDLWGDTVNTASRMESHGEPGRIQATHAIYERLRDRYLFEYRGEIEVKGKGRMQAWWLFGRKPTG